MDRNKLLSLIEKPTHYTYIAKYIMNCTKSESLKVLNGLLEDGLVKESEFKGYFYKSD